MTIRQVHGHTEITEEDHTGLSLEALTLLLDEDGVELVAAGWRRDVPTFFSWLGVTMYLTDAATFATLAASAVKVALVYDDYATSTTSQREYAYLADNAWAIVAGVRARVFGA